MIVIQFRALTATKFNRTFSG